MTYGPSVAPASEMWVIERFAELTRHADDEGDGSDASKELAHDPALVIKHVGEQTGLTASKEKRLSAPVDDCQHKVSNLRRSGAWGMARSRKLWRWKQKGPGELPGP